MNLKESLILKDSLIRKGYLPENMPPSFTTDRIADYFSSHPSDDFLMEKKQTFRPSNYNSSKRGLTRRVFSAIHPVTAHDLAHFIDKNRQEFYIYFSQNAANLSSLSVPRPSLDGDRALAISSHGELETARLTKLSHYRFIGKTDISRFYHSIYTHSIPWAYHGKKNAKGDRIRLLFNKLDRIVSCGQDGQTVGIPVGPDSSRVVAELISKAIDKEFLVRNKGIECEVVRHVDDVWIGANSYADVERSLWRYREAIRNFELDINESKTYIYSGNFCFTDTWPFDISYRIDLATQTDIRKSGERLRSALEYAFSLAVKENDDGILRYAIYYIDKNELHENYWDNVEPFLKRCVVHFGHTVDYVSRLIVWRHFVHKDVDCKSWSNILRIVLNNNGRLGNDSEVCWAIYASMHLKVEIRRDICQQILENCGALTVLSLLHFADAALKRNVKSDLFDNARQLLQDERGDGPYWPLSLEWSSCQWPNYDQVRITDKTVAEMVHDKVSLFDRKKLTKVFEGKSVDDFKTIKRAIEQRVSLYDDEEEYDEVEGEN